MSNDIAAFASYRNDTDVAIFQDWPMPFTDDLATAFIESMRTEVPGRPGEWFQFAVEDTLTHEMLGDVAMFRNGETPSTVTVGYTLARQHWGKGYATEAVSAVISYAVSVFGATTLQAAALDVNAASTRLLAGLGFTEVGHHDRVQQVEGAWVDETVFQRSCPPASPTLGAVLVGGKSSRMGSPKSLTHVGDRSMFDHVTGAIGAAGLDVMVVGDGPTPDHRHRVVADVAGAEGPAAGITAALAAAEGKDVFVTAVDQPYLSAPTIRRLMSTTGKAAAPMDQSRTQVTCAVYRTEFLDSLRRLLATDPSPSIQVLAGTAATTVSPATWRSWGEDGRSWRSLDDADSIALALQELGPPP